MQDARYIGTQGMAALSAVSDRPLALTCGEPSGIGLDITLKAWRDRAASAVPAFVLYAPAAAVAERATALGFTVPIRIVGSPGEAIEFFCEALPVVDVPSVARIMPGRPDAKNGRTVIEAIDRATAAVVAGDACALVTNPIAKHVLYDAGFEHPGHTEYLAELAARHFPGRNFTSVMMLAADELRVVPLTIHVALATVPRMITANAIKTTARTLAQALRSDFSCAAPRIAVAGLNPHAGENGTMGTEDRDVIAPAVAELQAEGLDVRGPFSADTLFHAEARAGYDAVIAMYHDQALIPLKTLAFDRGVNITLGLPFVRTSPDHGTAFDIAGTGTASPASLIAALKMGRAMAMKRAMAAVPV